MLRTYICDSCDYSFQKEQKLHDPKRCKKCPQCGKHKLYQDLTGIYCGIIKDPTTIGHQADRNTKKMGKYELQEKRRKDALDKKTNKENILKKKGLVSDSFSLPDPDYIPPWGKIDADKARSIKSESNPKIKKERMKKYIEKGI